MTLSQGTPGANDGLLNIDGKIVDLSTPAGQAAGQSALSLLLQFGRGLIPAATDASGMINSAAGAATAAAVLNSLTQQEAAYNNTPANFDPGGNPAAGRELILLGLQDMIHSIAVANPAALTPPPPAAEPVGGAPFQTVEAAAPGGMSPLVWLAIAAGVILFLRE